MFINEKWLNIGSSTEIEARVDVEGACCVAFAFIDTAFVEVETLVARVGIVCSNSVAVELLEIEAADAMEAEVDNCALSVSLPSFAAQVGTPMTSCFS